MNTRDPLDTSSAPVGQSVSFNQDNSCFVVSLRDGFRVYKTEECDLNATQEQTGSLSGAQMLEKSQYLALVPSQQQTTPFEKHQVYIWNDNTERVSFQLSFDSPVIRALISKHHIVVILNTSVHLYAFSSPPQFLSKYETAANPFGLCALGPTSFAFPGRKAGHVMIVRFQNRKGEIVPAHGGPLRALAISADGEYLATASEKGTLIRLWSLHNGARISEFRRGVDPAVIFSLAFSKTSQFLAVSSDKGTLHIFEMQTYSEPDDFDTPGTEAGSTASPRSPRQAISRSSSYETLPTINTTYAPSSSMGSGAGGDRRNKWNFLSKMPMAPRIFKDNYSTCSCMFSIGDEPHLRHEAALTESRSPSDSASTIRPIGSARKTASRPPKGVIGWLSDDVLVVVGGGEDARWERFVLGWGEGGRREIARDGWKRYLEN